MVHHRFTVEDYDVMLEHGILTENDRVELIRGEILEKLPIGNKHAAGVKRINRLFSHRVGNLVLVGVQDPIRHTNDSEPEPDVTLLRLRADFYASGKPRPADVLLLVEVSDSTLDFVRDVKRPLYAEARLTEYWILNLVEDCLEVYRQPQADGTYAEVQILRRGQQVEITALPGIVFDVADLL
jgi:Uma2 family endonuclease